MKKTTLILITILLCINGYSQTFHSILLCKTNDSSIGLSVRINYSNIRELTQITSDYLGYDFKEYSLTGYKFTAKNVTELIKSLEINNNDIVFLYFSTHGAKSKWDSNKFPQVDVPDSLISAYKLHNIILDKSPKSIITLVEACSGFQRITPQNSFIYQSLKNEPVEEGYSLYQENFSKLFSEDCNIIVAAGQPGKNTWATSEGSMFTNCFIRAFQEYMSTPKKNIISWENLLLQTKQYTYAMTKTTSIKYYPVWEMDNCGDEKELIEIDKDLFNKDLKLKIRIDKKRNIFGIGNPYLVSLEIQGKNEVISEIEKVVYFLDNTMEEPIIYNTNKKNNFGYGFSVYSEFEIKAKVYFANGIIQDLYGNIKF